MKNTGATRGQIAEIMEQIKDHAGKIVVVKIGGNSIDEDKCFLPHLAEQLKFLQLQDVRVVLVHGGGPQIDRALKVAGFEPKKENGIRITRPEEMPIIVRELNKMSLEIQDALKKAHCACEIPWCLSRNFALATPLDGDGKTNKTGQIDRVLGQEIMGPLYRGKVFILNSIADGEGGPYNINADTFASAVAMAIKADRLIFMTNQSGVLDSEKKLITALSPAKASHLLEQRVIDGGMIPKVEAAINAWKNGVGGTAIINGHEPWGLVAELATCKGFGTLIMEPKPEQPVAAGRTRRRRMLSLGNS